MAAAAPRGNAQAHESGSTGLDPEVEAVPRGWIRQRQRGSRGAGLDPAPVAWIRGHKAGSGVAAMPMGLVGL